MFSLDAFASPVSFLQSTMTHQSVCAFIIAGKVSSIVARASGSHPASLSVQTQNKWLKVFSSFSFCSPPSEKRDKSFMLYHTKSATLLKLGTQQGCAEAPRIKPLCLLCFFLWKVRLAAAVRPGLQQPKCWDCVSLGRRGNVVICLVRCG